MLTTLLVILILQNPTSTFTVHVLCNMPLCLISAQAALPNDDIQMLFICYVLDYGPERAEMCRRAQYYVMVIEQL